jgi:diacylglycerol kinase (ATP)
MATTSIRKVHLLYNPHAGTLKGEKVARQALQYFEDHHIDATLWKTARPLHATEIAKSVPLAGYDAFCTIGGDGTLHEVVNGLLARPDHQVLPLCVIPAGTGNALAEDLGLGSVEQALEVVAAGKTRTMDLGHIKYHNAAGTEEERYFLNLVGLGMGVRANILAEKLRFFGLARYNMAIMVQIMKNKGLEAQVVADGQTLVPLGAADAKSGDRYPLSIIMVQNTIHGGKNLKLAPAAKIDDGLLDLVFAPKMTRTKMFSLFNKVVHDGSHVKEPGVTARTFKTLEISTRVPEPINIDGENCGTTPLEISLRAAHLTVLSR